MSAQVSDIISLWEYEYLRIWYLVDLQDLEVYNSISSMWMLLLKFYDLTPFLTLFFNCLFYVFYSDWLQECNAFFVDDLASPSQLKII